MNSLILTAEPKTNARCNKCEYKKTVPSSYAVRRSRAKPVTR